MYILMVHNIYVNSWRQRSILNVMHLPLTNEILADPLSMFCAGFESDTM